MSHILQATIFEIRKKKYNFGGRTAKETNEVHLDERKITEQSTAAFSPFPIQKKENADDKMVAASIVHETCHHAGELT